MQKKNDTHTISAFLRNEKQIMSDYIRKFSPKIKPGNESGHTFATRSQFELFHIVVLRRCYPGNKETPVMDIPDITVEELVLQTYILGENETLLNVLYGGENVCQYDKSSLYFR